MQTQIELGASFTDHQELIVTAAFSKTNPAKGKKAQTKEVVISHWPKEWKSALDKNNAAKHFTGDKGEWLTLALEHGATLLVFGLGEKKDVTFETLRRQIAESYKQASAKFSEMAIDVDAMTLKNDSEKTLQALVEGFGMAAYQFDKHLSTKNPGKLKKVTFAAFQTKKSEGKKWASVFKDASNVVASINLARDFVNEPPNILNSVEYARLLEKDAKTLPRVKTKVLDKAAIKKEKMGLLLSVNNGSGYEARVTHFTYTPKKVTSKTKHICLVGKGLTFDTGGYSLKPGASMMNMKFDMAGSATVYAAFRAAALLEVDVKVTCILGITDNAINSFATMPDSIVKGRNGKTVEILNTDAEGRLVLADCLDYACDQKPDAIINAATLTGACLVAVGHEVCAVMGNEQKLVDKLLGSAKEVDERMWQLPLFEEFLQDIKSPIADLKNIGGKPFAGSSKAGIFLQQFIKNDIPWAHLDIAGIGDSQGHLPYCPAKGASGLIVRSVLNYITSQK